MSETATIPQAPTPPPRSLPASPTPTPAEAKPAKLDDIMIAMDVVDMVRHRKDLVERELNEAGRETDLVARLKEIYRQQGIEVPDSVLAEGVKALKESRFTYTPPPASLKRALLTAWVRRKLWGPIVAAVLAVIGGSWGYNYVNVTLPAIHTERQARVEVSETLPKAIRTAHADIGAVSTDQAALLRANQLLTDGERAVRDKDRDAMTRSVEALKSLRADVLREYTLTIISRPGETSGVWRHPPHSKQTGARNYYLLVDAIGPDGKRQRLPIRNEETGQIETVETFGVRVPKTAFDAVAADKRDDGIIQNNKFGVKRRGVLAVDYVMPYEGGMITRW